MNLLSLIHYIGSLLDVWTGCFASQCDRLALLACAALNGFHGQATYSWTMNGSILPGENTPLLMSGVGKYDCTVAVKDEVLSRSFHVCGESSRALNFILAIIGYAYIYT